MRELSGQRKMRPLMDDRWIAVCGFVMALVVAVVMLVTPPASSYEHSIYGAYPWVFWGLVVGALLAGYAVVIRSAIRDTDHWQYGLALVGLVLALVLFVPYFRGYPIFGRGDVLTHIGYIRDIQATARVGPDNIYPSIHMLVLSLAWAAGVPPSAVISAMAPLASLFAVASSVVLVATIYDRQRALLTVPFVTVLVSTHSAPFVVSVLFVPFVLTLFMWERRSGDRRVRAVLALSLVGLVLYHPLTTLFLLAVLVVYELGRLLHVSNLRATEESGVQAVGAQHMSHLLLASFSVWYLGFSGVVRRFQIVFRTLIGSGEGESDLATYSSTIAQYTPAPTDLLRLGLLDYGKAGILLSVAGVYTLIVVAGAAYDRVRLSINQTLVIGAFLLFTGVSAVFLTVDLVDLGFGRPLLFAKLFAGLLAGPLFYELLAARSWRRVGRVAVYVLMAALVVISTFGMFPSPVNGDSNVQMTAAELDGGAWLLENRDTDTAVVEFGVRVYRLGDALYGQNTYPDRMYLGGDRPAPPEHFNYDRYEELGRSYESDRYVVITASGRKFYPGVYPEYREFWGFTPADFQRLERDSSVDRLYDNGDFDVYIARGRAEDAG